MFKKLTKFIVSELDPRRELVPVESLADNEHFRPLCLLIKKRKSSRIFHPAPYYKPTRLTLHDVLEPGEEDKHIEATHQDSSQFTLTKISTDQAHAGLSTSFDPASVELKGGASLSKKFSIMPRKKRISLESLEALRRERKINMNHSFIPQLQRIDLHVVTEIFEASEETEYHEYTRADGSSMAKLHATFFAKGTRENTQGIVIPKGCTLAFRTIALHIRNGEWSLGYIYDHGMPIPQSQGGSRGKLWVVVKEVENRCQIFSKLSPDLQLIILNTIKAVMRDKNLLQELSQKMEEILEQNDGYELKTESPDLQPLFSTLQHSPTDALLLLAMGITYVLDALHELMEDQLRLLLESLERKIVSQQLKLVENLLKHDLDKGKETFFVDASLLFSQEEEQRLTMEQVQLSGVELQANGSVMSWGKPFEAVAALFVALYILNLLSGSK